MRTLFSILITALLINSTYGQATYVYCDFESNCEVITIDTGIIDNIWQIGFADKPNFSFISNTIVTDTTWPYPPNNYSAFKLKYRGLRGISG